MAPVTLSNLLDSHSVETAEIGRRYMIDAVEFRKLAVSHRKFVRADEAESRLRGLRDVDTGEVFLVDERRLFVSNR